MSARRRHKPGPFLQLLQWHTFKYILPIVEYSDLSMLEVPAGNYPKSPTFSSRSGDHVSPHTAVTSL